jgi:hypothetical protein
MYQLRSVIVASLILVAVPAIAHPSSNIMSLQKVEEAISLPQKHFISHFLLSQSNQNLPIIQEQDWTKKDVKLPWNQLALDKFSGVEEPVVFTKSYKFKVGFFTNSKERVHVRWTQNRAEISIMSGSVCSAIFGCAASANYGLPKQISITISGQEYLLRTVDQNTYGLTPELKQAITQATEPLAVKIDKKIHFEIKKEAIPVLKQLFIIEPANTPPQ